MKLKIDLRPILTDPLHWVRIVLYVTVAMVAFSSLQHAINRRSSQGGWCAVLNTIVPMLDPAMLAGGIEVEEAMNAFAGYGSRGVWRGGITAVMTSMVFLYLLGPTLFVWGLRARVKYRQGGSGAPHAAVIAGALACGGCSLLMLLPGLYSAYAAIGEREQDVWRSKAMQEECALLEEISLMARKAQVAYFVAGEPWQLAGSWQMSDGSKQPALSIVQLIDPGVDAVIKDSRHAVIRGRSYELIVERADSLTLRGACPPVPLNKNGEPAFETGGGRSITIGVTPALLALAYDR